MVLGMRHLGKWKWMNAMAKLGFAVPAGTVWDKDKGIYFRDLDMWFKDISPLFKEVLPSFEYLTINRNRTGAVYKEVDDHTLQIELDGLVFTLNTSTEFHTVTEIFARHIYQFTDTAPYLIFDGGMNKGLASLFFAKYFDAEVFSFELIPATAAQAQRNVDMNPGLAGRIHTSAVGLSNENKSFDIKYTPEHTNLASLHDLMPAESTLETVKVHVRDASEVIDEALARFPGRTVVLKLDIEGSEYEVIPRLKETGTLCNIDVIVMEWHGTGNGNVTDLTKLLREEGFTVFTQAEMYMAAGMLYAVKGSVDRKLKA